MSNLVNRNPALAKALIDAGYPALLFSLVSFITEDAVVRLIEAGGKAEGNLVFNVKKGQVISFTPQMELKAGFEVKP